MKLPQPQLRVNDDQADILVEIASIAANHAAGAMAKVIGEQIDVEVPILELTELERARDVIGKAEQNMTAVTVQMTGDVHGVVFLLLTPQDAQHLVAEIAKGLETSALEEVANIITGAALSSLQRFTGLKFGQTVPGTASDMLGAVVDDTVAATGEHADHILVLGIQFLTDRRQVRGKLFFMFDPQSIDVIVKASLAKTKVVLP